jgi:hypothetical protein
VRSSWDGAPLPDADVVTVELGWEAASLAVAVDAPFYGDPAPSGPPGPTERLWEHEVVELFLLERPDHYLELELGPHGHHLALELCGAREVVRAAMPIDYQAHIANGRWTGHARIAREMVPPLADRANAYAIHGQGARRRYSACFPVPGATPDFHRLEHFRAIAWYLEP